MSDTEDEKRLHRNKIKQEWRAKNKDKIKKITAFRVVEFATK
jgi:hypothetical protein